MCRRVLTALLLVLTLATGNVMPVRGQQANVVTDEDKLTAEEEREAVRIAGRFVKGFEEKNDPSYLIEELYVKDFDARLRNELNSFIYLAKVEPEVIAKASDKELRRLYAASLNFIYTSGLLYGISLYNRKLKGIEAEVDDDTPLSELLPPGVMEVLKGDPLMAALIAEDEERESERKGEQANAPEQRDDQGAGKEERADSPEIRSLERLQGFLSTLEKAAAMLREYLKTVQAPHTWKELTNALRELGVREGDDDSCEGMCPRIRILDEEFFGSPKGTRLVCVNVIAFHMDLVRVDGRLRILNIYLSGN